MTAPDPKVTKCTHTHTGTPIRIALFFLSFFFVCVCVWKGVGEGKNKNKKRWIVARQRNNFWGYIQELKLSSALFRSWSRPWPWYSGEDEAWRHRRTHEKRKWGDEGGSSSKESLLCGALCSPDGNRHPLHQERERER